MLATVVNWIGQDLVGRRYQVRAKLPGGGMAEVYRARDRHLKTDVVIKVPLRSLFRDRTFAARFSQEVRSLVRLAHPHVMRVLDVGDRDGLPFAVLPYLAGGSLYDQLVSPTGIRRPRPAGHLVCWLAGIAEALDFIHSQNYIHRDVKPGNILFDGHGNVFLSDFGVVKALAGTDRSNLTQRGTVPGTLQYVAPEVFHGKPADGRVDQYALGVTVYEALAGRWPFDGITPAELVVQQTNIVPPSLSDLIPGLPAGVAQAVARALAKEPDQRFPDCRSFARAVLDALPPMAARAPSSFVLPGTPVAQAKVTVPCPLCQEVVELADAHRGWWVKCPGCEAVLNVSADLTQLTAGASPSGPDNFDMFVAEEETSLARMASSPTASQPMDLPYSALSPTRGPAAIQLPPPLLPQVNRRRSKGARRIVLPLVLLGVLAAGTYFALAFFGPDRTEKSKETQSAPKAAQPKGRVLIVSQRGDGDYTTITAALKAARSGTQVRVRPGIYAESIRIAKRVDLRGDGPAKDIIIKSSGKPCVLVETVSARLGGLTLLGLTGDGPGQPALVIHQGAVVVEACDIISAAQDGVAVSGKQTNPLFRKCQLHESRRYGIRIDGGAQATLEDCDIFQNGGAGVLIDKGGNPVLHGCRIHHGRQAGVVIGEGGQGRLLDCAIFANAQAGIVVKDRANPVVRGCKVYQGEQAGILVANAGRGTFVDCDIFNNPQAGVAIQDLGEPVLRGCRIRNTLGIGLLVCRHGHGTVEECEISGSAEVGVEIADGANPHLRNCRILNGKAAGVLVSTGATGTLEDCRLIGSAATGLTIQDQANPVVRRCLIRQGKQGGVLVRNHGNGRLESCTIAANALAGVEVLESGNPTLITCTIESNLSAGLFVHAGGKGTLEQCLIRESASAGVEIAGAIGPVLRRCTIRDGATYGVNIYQNGKGTLTNCDIAGNHWAGVQIGTGADPVIRGCRIHDGRQGGVYVSRGGRGTLEDCDIFRNTLAGIAVGYGANPTIRKCKVHDGHEGGISLFENARGTLEDCEVYANALAGVHIQKGADPLLRRCRIHDGRVNGLSVEDHGKGTVVDCTMTNNGQYGVDIRKGGAPVIRGCTIRGNKRVGVYVAEDGAGRIENCDVGANGEGAWRVSAASKVQRRGNRE